MAEVETSSSTTMSRQRPLIGGALSVAALTAFARLNGGIREVLIAREFGTSAALEAFLVGFALISLLVVAISGALPGALVPTFFRMGSQDHVRGSALLSNLLGRLTLWLIAGAVLVAVAAPSLAAAIGGGFDGGTRDQLRSVIVILAPVIVVGGWSSLMTSLVNAREKFTIGALPQVLNPITTILVIWFVRSPRSTTLAVAFLAGYVAELAASVVVAWLSGVRLRRHHAGGRSDSIAVQVAVEDRRLFFRMFLPMFVALAVQASSTVIDQAVASHLPQGDVAILAFGTRVTGFVTAVGITAVGTVVLPQFSRLTSARQGLALAESVRAKAILVAVVGCAVALVLSLASEQIQAFLFGHGRFSASDVESAAQVQAISAWQVPIQLVSVLYLKVLSASHRQRAVLGISFIAAGVNLPLDIALAAWFGVRGIVLSTTAVLAVTCIAYRFVGRRDIRRLAG